MSTNDKPTPVPARPEDEDGSPDEHDPASSGIPEDQSQAGEHPISSEVEGDQPQDEDPPTSYEVGYGKPPVSRQFQKGQSGFPTGRPKGVRNLKTDLSEALAEKVPATEGGKTRKLSKQMLICKAQIAKAARGDTKAATFVIGTLFKVSPPEVQTDGEMPSAEKDEEIIENYLAWMKTLKDLEDE